MLIVMAKKVILQIVDIFLWELITVILELNVSNFSAKQEVHREGQLKLLQQ
jgi:hypothetical protein